ncbi:DUF5683 domain-containing protein [Sediminitomix flava]|uniref:DUF5683 domain-containing protein n=1 Tax=Sediminitomix flava TaxID=379075 RepID=UPI0011B1D447|nr:DUF5683 domain-containing protein [Sediminitomix flava]
MRSFFGKLGQWRALPILIVLLTGVQSMDCFAQGFEITTQDAEKYASAVEDSLLQLKKKAKIKEVKPQSYALRSPSKAALLSAVIPGAGQIYNKSYWKVPVAWAGSAIFGYLIGWNHVHYLESKTNLAYLTDNDPTNDELIDDRFAGVSADAFRRNRDRFRRDRDFFVILTVVWYGIVVGDAAVDAHFKNFDLSEDLSARIQPTLIEVGGPDQFAPGFKIAFSLNN